MIDIPTSNAQLARRTLRDAFEDWARADHRALEPEQYEAPDDGNNQYYVADCDNDAFIGWKAALSAALPSTNHSGPTGIEAANLITEYISLRFAEGDHGDAANIIHILHEGGVRLASPSVTTSNGEASGS